MGGRLMVAVVSAAYAAATAASAVADGSAQLPTRAVPAAVMEAIPAFLLAVLALRAGTAGSQRRGALLFAVAMTLLAAAVVVTSGTHANGIALTVGALLAVNAVLAVAYLRVLSAWPRRRRAATAVLLLPCLLAALGTASAVSLARTPIASCGVDSCAFNGIGIAYGLGIGCECAFLVALVPALAADLRAGLGVVLFGVGTNLLLVVAPQWSQAQGVIGVVFGYAGLALAALPWLAPRERGERPGRDLAAQSAS
jgi:hypothetical protein